MAFGWVIRHQKKALFVLAVVLIVGWGLSGMIMSLVGAKSGRGGAAVIGSIGGHDVTNVQFSTFKRRWAQVFPQLMGRDAARDSNVKTDDIAWAYYGLLDLARQEGMEVSDDLVLENKRAYYRQYAGQNARLDASAERFFIDKLGITGMQVDEILREYLMAEKMMRHILRGLEPTQADAWELYSLENRGVRLKYVEFTVAGFMSKTAVPTEDNVTKAYDENKGPGRLYFNPPAVQIEFAQVLYSKLEPDVKVTTDEMKKFYDDNKDLYKMSEAKEGKEAEYIPFPEVKPEIESSLKRRTVAEKASQIMENIRTAFAAAPGKRLEEVVKEMNVPALEYRSEPFLTDAQLLELPDIGTALSEGKNLAQMAFESEPASKMLSPVMTSAEGKFAFRSVVAPREPGTPDLAEVKGKVIADIRKGEAFNMAVKAAVAFDNDVTKAGPAKFEDLALAQKLTVKETPFFVNNGYDAACPDFMDRACPLDVGAVYGPMAGAKEEVVAVVKVIADRPADKAGFAAEEKDKLDKVLDAKLRETRRALVPYAVLKFLNFKPAKTAETDNTTSGQ